MKLLPWDSRVIKFNRATLAKFMIAGIRIRVSKSNKEQYKSRQHRTASCCGNKRLYRSKFNLLMTQRSTVRRRISRCRTRDIANYIASNFSLYAEKRHPHIREASTKLSQLRFFHVDRELHVYSSP